MERPEITVGVDSHKDFNVAVALDGQGRVVGTTTAPTTQVGYSSLFAWAKSYGLLAAVGIEGTGSYGAGLCRHLRAKGVRVLEVERPERKGRRGAGKTDSLDAERAARAVLSGKTCVLPKGGDGAIECLRLIWSSRRGAVKARTQAANQLHGLLVTAPDSLRGELRRLTCAQLAAHAARWRVGSAGDHSAASRLAMRSVARRYILLGQEVKELDREIRHLVDQLSPRLVAARGIGYETAAALLVAAGDNPERMRSEAAFAHLCGASPIPASSGKTVRHRLNRGGERQANRALFLIVLVRMYRDEATKAYIARRTAEGLSKPEIIRCLKRYVAREVFALLPARGGCKS